MTRYVLGCLLLLVATTGCEKPKRYKLADLPYCDVGPGLERVTFKGRYELLHRRGDDMGLETLSGDERQGISTISSDAVYALVSCGGPPSVTGVDGMKKALEGLDEKNVPTVCPQQATVFHKVLTAEPPDDAAKAAGFSGVVRFPKVELICEKGALKTK